MLEHLSTLLGIELLQNIGDVCRMQLVEALVRHGKLHLGQVAVEKVQCSSSHDLLFDLLVEHLRRRNDRLFKKRMQAAQNAAHAYFGAQEAQRRTPRAKA